MAILESSVRRLVVGMLSLVALVVLSPNAFSQGDPFIRDTPTDSGVEPNPDTGSMYVSQDIWVRNNPDPNYDPRPFPTGSPTWSPLPHENPEFDDPKTGFPAYVYVRLHNRGRTATSGTAQLRVYWAKASTGLGWPTQWVDYIDTTCGPPELHGLEITKPRKNTQTASTAERNAYRDALLEIETNVLHRFSDGVQYWEKQNTIHNIGGALHGIPGFLPWHREMVNRLEVLMRESNPLLTMLYWDWTNDPRVGVDLFTTGPTGFMGTASGTVGAPLTPLQPPTLSRNVGFFGFSPHTDGAIVGELNYPSFLSRLESTPNHNSAHGFIGGPSGQISSLSTAAQDPFFFLLHGNVDRIWAQWQRDPNRPERLDPATAYGSDSGHSTITSSMGPWDGSTGVTPWTTQPYVKAPPHASVVSPPIYDTVPLLIPVLQPNESVVIQVPWFPPDPGRFSCFGDSGHFCLLARIETSTTFPFGMTTPEGMNVSTNTRNNNNIAWKNITVVDNVSQLRFLSAGIVRNFLPDPTVFRIRFKAAKEDHNRPFFAHGKMRLSIPKKLAERWRRSKAIAEGIEIGQETDDRLELFVAGDGSFLEVELMPKDSFPVELAFELNRQIPDEVRRKPFAVDMEQVLVARGSFIPETVVGGLRFMIDVSKFTLVPQGSNWTILDDGTQPAENWMAPNFDDLKWRMVKAPRHSVGRRHSATYLRAQFNIEDPSLYERLMLRHLVDDGAVVYLNGKEVHRRNVAEGEIGPDTQAIVSIEGVKEQVYWIHPLDTGLLKQGDNTIAVAVYQSEDHGDDLHFDLELVANELEKNLTPEVKIRRPSNGRQFVPGEAIEIVAEALDQDQEVAQVQLFVDGARVRVGKEPILKVRLDGLHPGSHRVTAEAVDSRGAKTSHTIRINVTPGLPPLVKITSPKKGDRFDTGEPIDVLADVMDARSADIVKVELFMRSGDFIPTGFDLVNNANHKPVAEATNQPYRLKIPPQKPGMYMLQVGATDSAGNVGASSHVKIHVME